jgi:hypothetical protein
LNSIYVTVGAQRTVNDTNRSFNDCPGKRLYFALVEIYVTTYGEANLVAATSSETRRRVRLHVSIVPRPWRIIPQALLLALLALRPAIVTNAVRSTPIAG